MQLSLVIDVLILYTHFCLQCGACALVEAREKSSINQTELTGRLGISYRTYLEYERGTNASLAMKALLNLLTLLDDQEVVRVVREWAQHKEVVNEQHQ